MSNAQRLVAMTQNIAINVKALDRVRTEMAALSVDIAKEATVPAANPWTLRDAAMVYDGLREVRGERHHPVVVAMLHTFASWVYDDETAWCGAFVGFVCRSMGYPTPRQDTELWRALSARYWLTVGEPVIAEDADANCIVVFNRGVEPQPGPDVLDAWGHVGFYVRHSNTTVDVLGGNQSNAVNVNAYPRSRVLGVRRMVRL